MTGSEKRPIWQSPGLVKRALKRELLSPEYRSNDGHIVRVGNHEVLSACANLIHESTIDVCDFAEPKGWNLQFPLLECVVERFFRGERATFGGFEVMKERRKATARVTPESNAKLTQAPSKPTYLAPVRQLRSAAVDIGGVIEIPGDLLKFAYRDGATKKGTTFTETRVPRTLISGEARVWTEYLYSLARSDDDDDLLRRGVIPGQVSHLSKDGIIRRTPIITLFRYVPGKFGSGMHTEMLCIEIHPGTGMLIDLRGIRQELGALMTATPQHHKTILKTLELCT